MELDIKYIASYLPYGLEGYAMGGHVESTEYDENPIPKLFTVHALFSDYQLSVIFEGKKEMIALSDFFPHLRPLTDLQNKELDFWIEFGAEINELNTDYLIQSLVNKTFYAKDIHFAFKVYEVLFKMHFDVFGLIEQELAIDINTLQK
jgi:hypothetical protein